MSVLDQPVVSRLCSTPENKTAGAGSGLFMPTVLREFARCFTELPR